VWIDSSDNQIILRANAMFRSIVCISQEFG
jgi:hypothetical protein